MKRYTAVVGGVALAITMLVTAGCGTRVEDNGEAAASTKASNGASFALPSDAPSAVTPDASALSAPGASVSSPAESATAPTARSSGGSTGTAGSKTPAGAATGTAVASSQPGRSGGTGSATPSAGSQGGSGSAPSGAPTTPGAPAPAPATPAASGLIVIGNVGTYSGPVGASETPWADGMRLWTRWINDRGGINGAPVQLIVADDGADPARHRAAVQDLVESKKVQAMVGNGEGVAGESGVDYLTKKGIPVIGNEGGTDWYYKSPMYFANMPTGDTYWRSMILGLAKVAKSKKIGWAVCVEAATACGGADRVWGDEGYAKQHGFDPVYRAKISLGAPDYTAECLSAQRAGAESMLLVADNTTASRFASSCTRQGYRPQWVYPTPTIPFGNPDASLEGAIGITNFFPWMKTGTPATDEYQAAAAKYLGGKALPGNAGGWANGKTFEKAARATPAPQTSAGILEGLWSFRNETVGGLLAPLTFTKGQNSPRVNCWSFVQLSKGKWATIGDGSLQCES